ncbi:MAG TPA: hypothetical protein VIY66_08040 [Candidatus Acidoferrales bacterium]
MTKETNSTRSTRRSFLKRGALLAAPLAAAVPAAVIADDGLKARLARLEDEAAIRKVHHAWLRQVNSMQTSMKTVNAGTGDAATPLLADSQGAALDRTVRSITADHAGEPDAIEVAADGTRAIGQFQCAVEVENPIAQDCTLARMAHAQGGGFVRQTERRVLKVEYVKNGGSWAIAKAEFAPI